MNTREIMEWGNRYLMRTYARYPLALVGGQGARVWDAEGREYLDFIEGLAVNSLGHCHPAVVAALREQAGLLLHTSNLFWLEPQVRLARALVEASGLDRAFFCNSGAEANEGALKLARHYAYHQDSGRYEVITMERSFHGRTLATLAATGQEHLRRGFAPLPQGFRYVPFNDLTALEEAMGATTLAVMLEPVQGEGGVYPASPDYLRRLADLCRQRGVLLILDEVQCGLGRSGTLFAYQHYGIQPDILTLAKALGGGVPIGALLARDEVAAAFHPGDHGSTFGGNPLACAAGLAFLETLAAEDLLANVGEVGTFLREGLERLALKYPLVREVRGLGLLLGFELKLAGAPLVEACRERGLLINCRAGNVLRLLPPLNVSRAEAEQALAILDEVLAAAG